MPIDLRSWTGAWPFAFASLLLIALFYIGPRYRELILNENGPVELSTAAFYLLAATIAVFGWLRTRGIERTYFAVWSLLCILFFGEETSWLQHQVGYATPEAVASRNAQGELNLHNLYLLQGGELLCSHDRLRWSTLLKAQHLFQLGFASFFLALPVAILLNPINKVVGQLRLPYPGPKFITAIWLTLALSIVLTASADGTTKPIIAEVREMTYALSILAFLGAWVAMSYRRDIPHRPLAEDGQAKPSEG